MVFSRFGSGRQSSQLQASESDVRQWHRGFGSAVGTGMPWCLPVFGSGCQSRQLQASKASFLAGSESDVGTGTGASEAPLGPACHGVFPFRKRPPKQSAAGSESDVRQWHRGFGMRRLGPACHGVFPFRKRAAKAVSCRLRKRR